jgi:hypothetical protein
MVVLAISLNAVLAGQPIRLEAKDGAGNQLEIAET